MRWLWLLLAVGLVFSVVGQEDEEYEDYVDEEYEDEEYEDDEEEDVVEPPIGHAVFEEVPVVETKPVYSEPVVPKSEERGDESGKRVVSFEFRLRKPAPVILSLFEARGWTDPAWDINISGTDSRHLKDIRMRISGLIQRGSGDRLYSLKNGDPFRYKLIYKFRCPNLEGFTHYSVNGGPHYRLDEESQIGVREVTVLPYNWCPYLNGEDIEPDTLSLIRKYESDLRQNDPDFSIVIDRSSTECVGSPIPGNVIIRCRDHYYLPGSVDGSVEYSFDLLPTRKNMLKCLKVNSCEPEGKCGRNAKCVPQERGEFRCVCKDGYRPPFGFSQSSPSDPIDCVDYCAPGQEGYLRKEEKKSPYMYCHATPEKSPYYELLCVKGSSLKNGVCVLDCSCQTDSTECAIDPKKPFEHYCRCRPGYEPVPESNLFCRPTLQKRSSIRLAEPSIMPIDQCSTYSEPGYIVVGNTGEIDDFDVDYNLPHQLAEEMIVHTGVFYVDFWLVKKPNEKETRTVKVRPVNRCLPQYAPCGIQCNSGMDCHPTIGEDYPRDINCTCRQPIGCKSWESAQHSGVALDVKYYEFISSHIHLQHSLINRETCISTTYLANLPNDTQCVDVAPPVIFLLGDNPTFMTSCIVCSDEHHPNSTHTEYMDKGAISYDYFDSEKRDLPRGKIVVNLKPVQDANQAEQRELYRFLTNQGYENFEDVSYSVYRYESSDRAGNTIHLDRHVFYITTNISKEVMKLVELQRQLDSIGEVISYIKQFIIATLVIVAFWFLFTSEGQRYLRAGLKKLLNPELPWGVIFADLDAEDIKKKRERKRINSNRSEVNDS